jgi:hypothetical protein
MRNKQKKITREEIENRTLTDFLREIRQKSNTIQRCVKTLEDMFSDMELTGEAKQEILDLFNAEKEEC